MKTDILGHIDRFHCIHYVIISVSGSKIIIFTHQAQIRFVHPVSGMMTVKGKVVEENGDHVLEDKHGVTYPLSVMEPVKVLSWCEYNR